MVLSGSNIVEIYNRIYIIIYFSENQYENIKKSYSDQNRLTNTAIFDIMIRKNKNRLSGWEKRQKYA